MRYGMLSLILAATLTGCAHISHQNPKTGVKISYTGSASGAVNLVHATDLRHYELASDAMNNDMSMSLVREADGGVRFNAGYGYGGYYPGGSVGGYAPPNTGYIPGHGFVTGSPQSTLPPLATIVVTTGVPTTQTSVAIEPCPTDHLPMTVAQQAACAVAGVKALTESRAK